MLLGSDAFACYIDLSSLPSANLVVSRNARYHIAMSKIRTFSWPVLFGIYIIYMCVCCWCFLRIHIEDLNLPKLPQPFEALRAFLDSGPWKRSRSRFGGEALDALDEELDLDGTWGPDSVKSRRVKSPNSNSKVHLGIKMYIDHKMIVYYTIILLCYLKWIF